MFYTLPLGNWFLSQNVRIYQIRNIIRFMSGVKLIATCGAILVCPLHLHRRPSTPNLCQASKDQSTTKKTGFWKVTDCDRFLASWFGGGRRGWKWNGRVGCSIASLELLISIVKYTDLAFFWGDTHIWTFMKISGSWIWFESCELAWQSAGCTVPILQMAIWFVIIMSLI